MLNQLNGMKAVVCGSTDGIGFAIAREFSKYGIACTLLARNEEKLKTAVEALKRISPLNHSYAVADFSDPSQVKNAIQQFSEKENYHILVNNTGGPPPGNAIDAEPLDFLNAFQQHLICNHILAKQLVQGMKSLHYGRIINILSTSVKIPIKGLGVSNTIRGAVASWAKTLSMELAPYGITVNNILPGLTETGRLQSLINSNAKKSGLSEEDVRKMMLSEIPAGRYGFPEEPASLALFLASPAAAYINGVSIPVDGGKTGAF